jgi:hypothetical protein
MNHIFSQKMGIKKGLAPMLSKQEVLSVKWGFQRGLVPFDPLYFFNKKSSK